MYGTVDASKLFFDDLTSFLVGELGFVSNPCDVCVVNEIINGKQCTVVWHVDDLKISHKDTTVVISIIKSLRTKYGTIMPLSINRGKVHEHLGMTFDYTLKGSVTIIMFDQIDNIIEEAPDIYRQELEVQLHLQKKYIVYTSHVKPMNYYLIANARSTTR